MVDRRRQVPSFRATVLFLLTSQSQNFFNKQEGFSVSVNLFLFYFLLSFLSQDYKAYGKYLVKRRGA